MKKLLLSAAMLLFAAVLLGTTTFAWFSMNRTVDAKGMKVKAKVDTSLLISNAIPTAETKTFEYDFADTTSTLLNVSTHSSDYTNHTTGLKYVTNSQYCDPTTGRKKADEGTPDLTYAEAKNVTTEGAEKTFYKDYVVYISTSGANALAAQDLTITISGSAVSNINGAVSADFYTLAVATAPSDVAATLVKSANYQGFLNAAHKDSQGKDKSTITISSISIPACQDATQGAKKALCVLIRVYIDGSLPTADVTKSGNENCNLFVRNNDSVNVADTTLAFNFSAKDHETK